MNDRPKLYPALRAAAFTGALALTLAGCKSNSANTAAVDNQDPAAANLAQPYTGGDAGSSNGQTQVMGQSESSTPQSSGQSYEPQSPAPIIRRAPAGSSNTQYYPVPQAQNAQYNGQGGSYDQGGRLQSRLRPQLQLQRRRGSRRTGHGRNRSGSTPATRIRPATRPRRQLHLDPRLLELRLDRLLLGPWRLVRSALLRRPLGPRPTGATTTTITSTTAATGAPTSATTAVSTTASDTSAQATSAVTGATTTSTTTVPSPT